MGERTARRRRYKRFGNVVRLSLSSGHNFYTGFSENVSSGGLFIASEEAPPEIGSRLLVSFTLPGHETPVSAPCEVRWLRDPSPGTPGGFGVRFVELPDEAAAAIAAFISWRDTLFYDDE